MEVGDQLLTLFGIEELVVDHKGHQLTIVCQTHITCAFRGSG